MALGDVWAHPPRAVPSTSGKQRVVITGKVVFTTSGAVDTTNSVTPQVTPSKPSGTGIYQLTFPKGANIVCQFTYHNADNTKLLSATGGPISEANGTAQFIVIDNKATDAAVNATSGDYVSYTIWGDS